MLNKCNTIYLFRKYRAAKFSSENCNGVPYSPAHTHTTLSRTKNRIVIKFIVCSFIFVWKICRVKIRWVSQRICSMIEKKKLNYPIDTKEFPPKRNCEKCELGENLKATQVTCSWFRCAKSQIRCMGGIKRSIDIRHKKELLDVVEQSCTDLNLLHKPIIIIHLEASETFVWICPQKIDDDILHAAWNGNFFRITGKDSRNVGKKPKLLSVDHGNSTWKWCVNLCQKSMSNVSLP